MEKDEYRKHYELEEGHWWFAGRRKIILKILERLKLRPDTARLLDAGCGTGFNLKTFQGTVSSFGLDYKEDAVLYCQKRKLDNVVRADAQHIPFKNGSFDIILLLDVLYHRDVRSDLQALHEARLALRPDGYLLVTDSAFNFLYSSHDKAVHARERYTCKSLGQRLEKTGFTILKISYFQFFLFLPILVFKLSKKLKVAGQLPASHLKPVNKNLNVWLYKVFSLEAFFLKHICFPFGCSLLCLARKK